MATDVTLTDMDAALEKAAASSDAVIRGMALRFKGLYAEFKDLHAFFSIYGSAAGQAPAQTYVKKVKAPVANDGRGAKPNVFTIRVRDMLLAAGRPMPLMDLYENYYVEHADETRISQDAFRRRTYQCRDRKEIVILDGVGYWIPDTPYPAVGDGLQQAA